MPHKSVLQEFSARVSQKSECHTRCPTRVHKSVPQKYPKRMYPTRVSHKSVDKIVKTCLSVCFRVRVCIRVRGFLFVCVCVCVRFMAEILDLVWAEEPWNGREGRDFQMRRWHGWLTSRCEVERFWQIHHMHNAQMGGLRHEGILGI